MMGRKRKGNKGRYQLVDEPYEEAESSAGNNKSLEECSPTSLQESRYSGTSKDVFHLLDDANIKVMGEVHVVPGF